MKYIIFIVNTVIDLGKYFYLRITERFPKVLTMDETLDIIISQKVSISRFGDGEFNLISKKNIGFQEGSDEMAQRLKEVLISNHNNCLICIPSTLDNLKGMTLQSRLMWVHLIARFYKNYNQFLDVNKQYPNSLITRPYMDLSDKKLSGNLFLKLKQIWDNRDVVVVEGENTKLGIGNDLFNNVRSVKRIITASKNAFANYDDIFMSVKGFNEDYLILIALGPTATILAYDLSIEGFQACDIGHIDIEYEWFLKQTEKKEAIKGKHVNELGTYSTIAEIDEVYESQIYMRIHK